MKASNVFKTTIQNHLQSLAEKDPLFVETLKKPNKNIDDCITYILNWVKDSKCNGFADEEIFNVAIHYYDEDDAKPSEKISGRVVVNHHVELTPEEISKAKQDALDKIIAEQKQKLTAKTARKKEEVQESQSTLF
mgnify:CR=1 FL=1